MAIITFFAPPAAFLACVMLGILSNKSWGGVLAGSVAFYVLTYMLMAVINKISAYRKPENSEVEK
jgi:uncharacterized membrane protein